MSSLSRKEKPIVFFDGICGLCNRAIDYIVRIDENQSVYIASLQSNTAQDLLPDLKSLPDSIVLYKGGTLIFKSAAVFEILRITKSGWRWIRIFRVLPTSFLDWIYDKIAKSRYSIFGKRDTCRIPSLYEKSYFLD